MDKAISELRAKCQQAKDSARRLAFLPTGVKNKALEGVATSLISRTEDIVAANKKDYAVAEADGMDKAMLDRLFLSAERIKAIAADVSTIASLPDPVGEVFDMRNLPNSLTIGKKRVPLGVIGALYESRPNVTVDISCLCFKAGNASILRGGKEAFHSNKILSDIVREALAEAGAPADAVQFIDNTDRSLVKPFLKMNDIVDMVIPRGGAGLIEFVRENASMPVVAGGIGVCHTYIDASADFDMATAITYNAKVQRPTVCNALDSLLVHQSITAEFLPMVAAELNKAGVEIHADEPAYEVLKDVKSLNLKEATEEDWGKEFLALTIAIKTVASLDDAMNHIAKYGSGHSEAIITSDYASSMRFLNEVDASSVYVNASTRFTDGSQFGLGAELGISTQKMHARGPIGLKELTSYKWIIFGNGQVRP